MLFFTKVLTRKKCYAILCLQGKGSDYKARQPKKCARGKLAKSIPKFQIFKKKLKKVLDN